MKSEAFTAFCLIKGHAFCVETFRNSVTNSGIISKGDQTYMLQFFSEKPHEIEKYCHERDPRKKLPLQIKNTSLWFFTLELLVQLSILYQL